MNEKALEAYHDEMLRTFARGVAHNFNNILTAGMGFLALAMENTADRDTLTLLRNVELCHQRITYLARQLLSFTGDEAPKSEVVRLYDVLRNALNLFDSIALKRRAVLICDFSPVRDVLLEVDEFRLLQVLVEILKNAAESLQAGRGCIHFQARETEEGVCIEIRDDGVGIDPGELDKVFAPFYTSKQIVGVGLGLSMAKSVIECFGGRLEITSEKDPAKGSGTSVRVYLPVYRYPEASVPTLPDSARVLRPGLRILVAVDSDQVRMALEAFLGAQDFGVEGADSEEELIEALQNRRGFDLIIADLLHSDYFADSLVALIRERSNAAILTLHTTPREMPTPAPGVASLTKPFDPARLMASLRDFPQLLAASPAASPELADPAGESGRTDGAEPAGGK